MSVDPWDHYLRQGKEKSMNAKSENFECSKTVEEQVTPGKGAIVAYFTAYFVARTLSSIARGVAGFGTGAVKGAMEGAFGKPDKTESAKETAPNNSEPLTPFEELPILEVSKVEPVIKV
jgi:hypothetical protein